MKKPEFSSDFSQLQKVELTRAAQDALKIVKKTRRKLEDCLKQNNNKGFRRFTLELELLFKINIRNDDYLKIKKNVKTIISNYSKIEKVIMNGLKFDKGERKDCNSKKKKTIVYVTTTLFGGIDDTINVCFKRFWRKNTDIYDKIENIIHELGHIAFGQFRDVSHEVYYGDSRFLKLTTEELLKNADSYSVFALTYEVGKKFLQK